MNEDTLNLEIRKFLKRVGITSQREIEKAVRQRIEAGDLKGNERLPVKMILEVGELGLCHTIDGEIALE
jgi:uncharacterized protein DUF6494